MRYPNWNHEENANYDRLSSPSAVSAQAVEGLAYTAVMEMYHARKERERHDAEKRRIVEALDQIADGICELERILGVSLSQMRDRHRMKMLQQLRNETSQGKKV